LKRKYDAFFSIVAIVWPAVCYTIWKQYTQHKITSHYDID